MEAPKNTVKTRIITAIGTKTIDRPRELQLDAGTNEHHVVHALYTLQHDGMVEFQRKRNADSPGVNLRKIKLTQRGLQQYRSIKK